MLTSVGKDDHNALHRGSFSRRRVSRPRILLRQAGPPLLRTWVDKVQECPRIFHLGHLGLGGQGRVLGAAITRRSIPFTVILTLCFILLLLPPFPASPFPFPLSASPLTLNRLKGSTVLALGALCALNPRI